MINFKVVPCGNGYTVKTRRKFLFFGFWVPCDYYGYEVRRPVIYSTREEAGEALVHILSYWDTVLKMDRRR